MYPGLVGEAPKPPLKHVHLTQVGGGGLDGRGMGNRRLGLEGRIRLDGERRWISCWGVGRI